MAQPALDTIRQLDSALAAAVATASPSVVQVSRGRSGGTGIAWAEDLVITSSFHTPDKTTVGIATDDGDLDEREAEVIGRDPGTDIALLRVAGGGLTPATFRERMVKTEEDHPHGIVGYLKSPHVARAIIFGWCEAFANGPGRPASCTGVPDM